MIVMFMAVSTIAHTGVIRDPQEVGDRTPDGHKHADRSSEVDRSGRQPIVGAG
jgi:hypothetical protein